MICTRSIIHDSSPPTLVLQLGQDIDRVNVYIKTGFLLPAGLVPGTRWKFTDVMKVVSKKENIYLGIFYLIFNGLVFFAKKNFDKSLFHFIKVIAALF